MKTLKNLMIMTDKTSEMSKRKQILNKAKEEQSPYNLNVNFNNSIK